ncbi:hypothetical protein ACWGAN_15995 [Streptomyces sp. NPDC054945]
MLRLHLTAEDLLDITFASEPLPLLDLLRPDGDNPPFVEPYARTLEEGPAVVRDAGPLLTSGTVLEVDGPPHYDGRPSTRGWR